MKRILLFIAVMLIYVTAGFSQAEFSTGALTVAVSEYGEIELFTPDGVYQLERATILVGTSPTTVFDWWNDADIEELTDTVSNPVLSDFEIYGAYNNAYSGAPPDVIVKLNAYGWNNGGYIIVKFDIKNDEAIAMDALAGLDIIPYINEEWGYDSVSYNSNEEVIRFHRGNTTNLGMKLLSSTLSSLFSFEWYEDYMVDEDYWTWMNYGSVQPLYASNTGDGPVAITSQAPVALAPGESFEVFYAMALGADEQTMLSNIAAAEQKYAAWFASVEDPKAAGNGFFLGQNYPNPVSHSTTISYQLPGNGLVTLKVYNSIGQEVATLVNSEQTAGSYTVQFNADGLTGGMYYYTLTCNDRVQSNKMFVIR